MNELLTALPKQQQQQQLSGDLNIILMSPVLQCCNFNVAYIYYALREREREVNFVQTHLLGERERERCCTWVCVCVFKSTDDGLPSYSLSKNRNCFPIQHSCSIYLVLDSLYKGSFWPEQNIRMNLSNLNYVRYQKRCLRPNHFRFKRFHSTTNLWQSVYVVIIIII